MNRIIFSIATVILFSTNASAQNAPPTYTENDPSKQLPDNRIFIGGAINLGFTSNTFQIGGTPEIGYTVAQWLDAGLAFNINYYSERADPYYNNNVRYHNLNYGGGPFLRIFPVRFLFIQGQLERNWVKVNAKDEYSGYTSENTYRSTSLIAGIGYCQRIVGQGGFYTLIGLDVLNDAYSPYRDYNGYAIPIIRAGFNFYLKGQKK